jgi:hypothetical protein
MVYLLTLAVVVLAFAYGPFGGALWGRPPLRPKPWPPHQCTPECIPGWDCPNVTN